MIELMRQLDTVLAVVLELAGQKDAITAKRLNRVRNELAGILCSVDMICDGEETGTQS